MLLRVKNRIPDEVLKGIISQKLKGGGVPGELYTHIVLFASKSTDITDLVIKTRDAQKN
jgi:hypothetical protein